MKHFYVVNTPQLAGRLLKRQYSLFCTLAGRDDHGLGFKVLAYRYSQGWFQVKTELQEDYATPVTIWATNQKTLFDQE